MRKKLFILASLVCIVAISSPVYAFTTGYFDHTDFLTDLGSLTLTLDNFESDPWPPALSSKTQPTLSMGVSWTSSENLFTTNVVALSGLISISPLDVGLVTDELTAVLPANVFAVGGFVDNFDSFASTIQMATFDTADNPIMGVAISASNIGEAINWQFLGIITDTPIARVQFSSAGNDPDDFALDDFHFGVAAVPEPATMLLLGSGLIGLLAFRRKFRK